MNHITSYILIIFLLSFAVFGNAQIIPSPSAMSTVHGSEANLFLGQVSEVIPLASLLGKNGYTVPVQLVYQTKGIRVDEEASEVGLGWSLVAGGAITRVMRDEPDDQSTFRTSPTADNVRRKEVNGEKGFDFQKDIFYFSYPGGGGRFITTQTILNAATASFSSLPYNDLRINYTYTSTSNSYFEITDLSGIKYVFGKSANARETTTTKNYEQGKSPKSNQQWTYISTWYLEEIIFPNLPVEDKITLTYSKYSAKQKSRSVSSTVRYSVAHTSSRFTYKSQARVNAEQAGQVWSGTDYFYMQGENYALPGYNPVYFNYRIPIKEWAYNVDILEEQCVFSNEYKPIVERCYNPRTGTLLMKDNLAEAPYSFEHPVYTTTYDNGYGEIRFVSEVETNASKLFQIKSPLGTLSFIYSGREDIEGMEKLDKINFIDYNFQLKGVYDFTFTYFNSSPQYAACSNPLLCKRLKLKGIEFNGSKLVGFSYWDEQSAAFSLPSKDSETRKDIFGYCKPDVASKYTPVNIFLLDQRLLNTPAYSTNLVSTQAGLAGTNEVKISGVDRQPNDYNKAGMLWKVEYSSGAVKEYSYQSNKFKPGPIIKDVVVKDGGAIVMHNTYSFETLRVPADPLMWSFDGNYVYRYSDSKSHQFDFNPFYGFEKATVTDLIQNQQSQLTFNWSNLPLPVKTQRKLNSWSSVDNLPHDIPPFISFPYLATIGLVREQKNTQTNTNYSETITYTHTLASGTQIAEHGFVNVDNNLMIIGSSYISFRPLQTTKISKTYSGAELIGSEETFSYSSSKPSLVSSSTSKSGEFEFRTEFKYPFDMPMPNTSQAEAEAFGYYEMRNRNMIGSPVQTISKLRKGGSGYFSVTGSTVNTFHVDYGMMLPFRSFHLELLEPIDETSLESVAIDYTKTYPSLKLDSRFSELLLTRHKSDGTLWYTVNQKKGIRTDYTWGHNNSLMTSETTNGFTTTYEHIPLVGISKTTDPNGRSTTYEYDAFNRLRLIRDHEGNIVERYRYHYASEDENLATSLVITGKNKVNTSLTFTSNNAAAFYGKTRYFWDFGEGNAVETAVPTVNKTFGTAGTKQVKLTLVNPEYDPIQVSQPLEIKSNDLTVSICRQRSSYDRCTSTFGTGDPCASGLPPALTGTTHFGLSTNSGAYCMGGLTYTWSYKRGSTGTWIVFSSEPVAVSPQDMLDVAAQYEIKCEVRDACTTLYSATSVFLVTETGCGGGGGPAPSLN